MNSLKALEEKFDFQNVNEEVSEEKPIKIKKSKGQLFKERHGYSKSLNRNMRKHGLNPAEFSDSINAYRDIRKKRKKAQKKIQQKKHEASALHMRSKGKTRKTKHKGRSHNGAAKNIYVAPNN